MRFLWLLVAVVLTGCVQHRPLAEQLPEVQAKFPYFDRYSSAAFDLIGKKPDVELDEAVCLVSFPETRDQQCLAVYDNARRRRALQRFIEAQAAASAARPPALPVMGPLQLDAYGPGVHMDQTGRAVRVVPY
ncbi:hypothetical protein [Plasticicumulans sp.]|uniref:hypothetical protein n=1 Tax=Plasticicumulans sp. TaxID=2307179 RepID=UPI003945EAA9